MRWEFERVCGWEFGMELFLNLECIDGCEDVGTILRFGLWIKG